MLSQLQLNELTQFFANYNQNNNAYPAYLQKIFSQVISEHGIRFPMDSNKLNINENNGSYQLTIGNSPCIMLTEEQGLVAYYFCLLAQYQSTQTAYGRELYSLREKIKKTLVLNHAATISNKDAEQYINQNGAETTRLFHYYDATQDYVLSYKTTRNGMPRFVHWDLRLMTFEALKKLTDNRQYLFISDSSPSEHRVLEQPTCDDAKVQAYFAAANNKLNIFKRELTAEQVNWLRQALIEELRSRKIDDAIMRAQCVNSSSAEQVLTTEFLKCPGTYAVVRYSSGQKADVISYILRAYSAQLIYFKHLVLEEGITALDKLEGLIKNSYQFITTNDLSLCHTSSSTSTVITHIIQKAPPAINLAAAPMTVRESLQLTTAQHASAISQTKSVQPLVRATAPAIAAGMFGTSRFAKSSKTDSIDLSQEHTPTAVVYVPALDKGGTMQPVQMTTTAEADEDCGSSIFTCCFGSRGK